MRRKLVLAACVAGAMSALAIAAQLFFAFEEYRNTNIVNFQTFTVPTPEYRAGDFSALLTGRQLVVSLIAARCRRSGASIERRCEKP